MVLAGEGLVKTSIGLALAALMLAGCGGSGGDRATLIKACTEDGSSAESCGCMADAAEAELDPKVYKALVQSAASGDDAVAQKVMEDLSSVEQGQVFGFFMKAALECGMN